jgi:type II secretory pathway component PulF
MQQYRYEAANQEGELIRGIVLAPDLSTARQSVEARRLQPLKVLEIPRVRPDRPRRKRLLFAWR